MDLDVAHGEVADVGRRGALGMFDLDLARLKELLGVAHRCRWISIVLGENHWRIGMRERQVLAAVPVELGPLSVAVCLGDERNDCRRVTAALTLGVQAAARVGLLEVRSRRHCDSH